jgi:threonine/homoserine/homoserine lactone efflux protein
MLVVFVGMTLLAALTPGLAVLLVTSNALKKGCGAAWRAIFGIEIGNAVYVFASATGLTALLVASAPLFTAVRWAGAVYLIYLGVRLVAASLRTFRRTSLCAQNRGRDYRVRFYRDRLIARNEECRRVGGLLPCLG